MYEGQPLLYLSADQTWTKCHLHKIQYEPSDNSVQMIVVRLDATGDEYRVNSTDVAKQLKLREDADDSEIGNADLIQASKKAAAFLCNRNRNAQVYSKCGPVLVFMAHTNMARLFGNGTIQEYRRVHESFDRAPHLYGKLREAMYMIEMTQADQNVIFIGNRSSGKTMQLSKSIEFITSGNDHQFRLCQAALGILEAFGSIHMQENPNSSRFASLVTFYFQDRVVSGCNIATYMLETWRLVDCTMEKKSFHIYYALNRCEDLTLLRRVGFIRAERKEEFAYLKKTIDNFTECKWTSISILQVLCKQLDIEASVLNMWLTVACVCLRLGNLEFVCNKDKAVVQNVGEMDFIGSKLGTPVEFLQEKLSAAPACRVDTQEERERMWITEAKNRRDALACFIYQRLFLWIVRVINEKIKGVQRGAKLCLLDGQGFETGKNLGFDQLLVNYCNERLYGVFEQSVNYSVQQEYEREKVIMPCIPMTQNNIIAAETNRVILRECLDRSSTMTLPSPTQFVQLVTNSSVGRFVSFSGFKMTVTHPAGQCEYDTTMFPSQNRQFATLQFVDLLRQSDTFHDDLILPSDGESQVISHSPSPRFARSPREKVGMMELELPITRTRGTTDATSPTMSRMSPTLTRRRNSSMPTAPAIPDVTLPPTTSSLFCCSFQELLTTLQRNNCHFVVCLTNGEEEFVQTQMNSTRLSYAIDVCSNEGRPIHIPYVNLFQRYWMISDDSRYICSVSSADSHEYFQGTTNVFFTAKCVARLEKIRYMIRRAAAKKILPLFQKNLKLARQEKNKFLHNCLRVWLDRRAAVQDTSNETLLLELLKREEELRDANQEITKLRHETETMVRAIKTSFPCEWAIQQSLLSYIGKGTYNPYETHAHVNVLFDFLYDRTMLFTCFHPDTFPMFALVSARLIIYHGYSQEAILSLYQVFQTKILTLQDMGSIMPGISNLCFLISWMHHSDNVDPNDIIRFVHILNSLCLSLQKNICDSLSILAYEYVCTPSRTGTQRSLDSFTTQLQKQYAEMKKYNLPNMLIRHLLLTLMHNIDVRIANSIMLKSFVNVECTFTFQPDLATVSKQIVSIVNDNGVMQRGSWKNFFPIVFDIVRLLSYPDKKEAVDIPEMFTKLTDAHMLELISKYKFCEGEARFDIQAVVYRLKERVGKRSNEISFIASTRQFKKDQVADQFCVIPSSMVCQVVASATFSVESFLRNEIKRG